MRPAPTGFDIETARADSLFTCPGEFGRLFGALCNGEITITSDAASHIAQLNSAPWIYGHNVFGFDLLALAYHYGADWDKLSAKAVDTLILARLDHPPRARDTGGSEDRYGLDHVSERLGFPGKSGDLREIIKKHGGYDQIPPDDPEYRAYLAGDLLATERIMRALPRNDYARREHRLASLAGRMTLNGFRVNTKLLAQRITEGETRKREALEILRDEYGLPLGGFAWTGRGKDKQEIWEDYESPLATLPGRKWLLETYGIYGVTAPPVTDTGRLATSADALAGLTADECHPELRHIADLMRQVTTTRTVYQTVADHLARGDRVHALVSMGQASGRWSVTKPGLTVFGKRGGRHHERDVFLPEPGHVLISFDMSQVDMRAIAGHCQDPAYMALFEPGKDVHTEIAIQLFGNPGMRESAKGIGHGANYGLGANRMIRNGFDPELVKAFFTGMQRRFPVLMEWREGIRADGAAGKLLDNGFGRKMRCEPARAFTQAPALMGQGTARDLVCEALLRLPAEVWPMLRVMVHDEIVVSVPKRDAKDVMKTIKQAFTSEWRGVPILSDMSSPGANWGEVSAK